MVNDIVPWRSGQREASDLQQLRHALVRPQGPHVKAVVIQQGHQLQLCVETRTWGRVRLNYNIHQTHHVHTHTHTQWIRTFPSIAIRRLGM